MSEPGESRPPRCACPGCRQDAVRGGIYCPTCDDAFHLAHCPRCRHVLSQLAGACPKCGADLAVLAAQKPPSVPGIRSLPPD